MRVWERFLHLQSNCMLMFPLHVVDVPGHSLHGVNGFLHNLMGLCVLLHVVGYLLHRQSTFVLCMQTHLLSCFKKLKCSQRTMHTLRNIGRKH